MRSPLAAVLCVVFAGCYGPDAPPGQTQVITSNPGKKARAIEIAGGTLAIAQGGRFALASDPDTDRVWVVELTTARVKGKVVFPAGSQPQRLVEDGDGRVRVALRGTGQIATISPVNQSLLSTVDACPEVRGLTWNTADKALLVACAGGELVTMKDGVAPVVSHPAADLRDVVLSKGKTFVSTFRSAKLVEVNAGGSPAQSLVFPSVPLNVVDGKPTTFVPAVAWKSIATPAGQIVTVHHREVEGDIGGIQVPAAPVPAAYYQNTCQSSIVRSTVSVVDDGKVVGSIDIAGVLPVDVAVSPDNEEIAVAQPGSRFVQRVQLSAASAGVQGGLCAPQFPDVAKVGQVTGVAYTPQNDLVVQTRSPNAIWVLGKANGMRTQQQILLTASEVESEGFDMFHNAVGAISCASCHPEGGDDGHVWTLFKQEVRTQSLAGGVTQTAPFHWTGSLPNVAAVVNETLVGRMGGTEQSVSVISSLTGWMGAIRKPRAVSAAPAEVVAAGKVLFESAETQCSSCHSGDLLTNNATMNVGTGGSFQVPSLRGVSLRGPWMHNGCATTLRDRFGECGGTKHGRTEQLAPADLDALVAYLETL